MNVIYMLYVCAVSALFSQVYNSDVGFSFLVGPHFFIFSLTIMFLKIKMSTVDRKQEPVEPGDAPRIGFGHRQEISSSQYDDHFCEIVLKSDFKK